MGSRFGEEGRRLSYGSYLKIPELLALQDGLSDEHDERLFIVAHQVYELWFKVLLFELETARDRIGSDHIFSALHYLKRVHVIERLLVEQIEVLETMSPQDFLAFRSQLAPASGFQSVQFREIEFLSGLKEPKYLARLEVTAGEAARLRRRLDEPSLDDAFHGLLERRGSPTLIEVFRDREHHGDLFDICEALLDHDEAFAHWRARHVLMVERQIGGKTGTGGSSGAEYLRSTLGKRFYPALWDVRSQL
ncbi:MAG: tryptophan 2,3-dioxygenase [Candidatus Dormibacteraceae bacterium]